MADSVEEIKKATKTYLVVGLLLFVGTVVTVAVATIPALDVGGHGFDTADLILGLLIASVKASLVLFIFMHLNHEKKLVYFLLVLGFVAGIFLMWLTGWAFTDPIEYGEGTLADEEKTGFYDPSNPVIED
ncbi:MAG: cytochrome C oxidase subunit IV family protein [Verrucomicrobiota bacterium]